MNGLVSAALGRLGQDAEVKFTRDGRAFLSCSLALHDSKAAEGTPTEWLKVSYFGEDAPALAERLTKGTECYIEGRCRLNCWTSQAGEQRAGLQLTAWKLEPLGQIGRRAPRPLAPQPA